MDELYRHQQQIAQRIADMRKPEDFAFNFTPEEQAVDLRKMTIDEQIEAYEGLVNEIEESIAQTREMVAFNAGVEARLREKGFR